jgi:hypothetical protein
VELRPEFMGLALGSRSKSGLEAAVVPRPRVLGQIRRVRAPVIQSPPCESVAVRRGGSSPRDPRDVLGDNSRIDV